MIQILSNIAFTLFSLSYLPVFLVKLKQAEDPKKLWRERWGNVVLPQPKTKRERIWLHAVSVGEVKAVEPFVKLLEARGFQVVLSTVTPTGQREARKICNAVFYFPFDLSPVVRKSLQTIRPDLILLAETELWPNFIAEAARLSIPVGVINGRLSKRSLARYQWIEPLIAQVLQKISFFLVQTSRDAEHFRLLGANPKKIQVAGNMKFDTSKEEVPAAPTALKASFQIPQVPLNWQVWVAGSTHKGEEEKVLRVFTRLRSVFSRLVCVIAPRHIERAREVETLVRNFNFRPVRFTELRQVKWPYDVMILDAIGELKKVYSFADAVWMGGSFVEHGGQNPIEPALFARPVLSGPHVFNFEFVYEELEKNQAVVLVRSEDELYGRLKELLENPTRMKEWGSRAADTVARLSGASLKSVEIIENFFVNKILNKPAAFSGAGFKSNPALETVPLPRKDVSR
jgi:3-deoxy-D-manno-octulosonic-acid transferase